MSFPLSPTNGQTATLNGIPYTYNSTTQAWTRVIGSTLTYTAINLYSTTTSTGTTTGALVVAGGAGIGGNLFVGNTSTFAGNILPSVDSIYSLGSSSTQWKSMYVSSSTIYVGGTALSIVNGTLQVGGSPIIASSTGTTSTFLVSNSTNSTSTTTGAIVVVGGIGVGGNINTGGTITGGGVRSTSTSTPPASPTVGDIWYNTLTDNLYRYSTDGVTSAWIDVSGPAGLGQSPTRNMIILSNSSTSVMIPVSQGYVNILNYSGSTINIPIY
jgi:hypothetical protein